LSAFPLATMAPIYGFLEPLRQHARMRASTPARSKTVSEKPKPPRTRISGNPNIDDGVGSIAGLELPSVTPQPPRPKDPDRWRKRRDGFAIAAFLCLLPVVIDLFIAAYTGAMEWIAIAVVLVVVAALMHFMQPDRR
jgi:hypothetical protein